MNVKSMLDCLARLVACDTQNPPRRIDADSQIFSICREAAGTGFDIDVADHGNGHVSWFAVKGRPSILFNVHLDTVPVGEGWSRDPLQLDVIDGKAYGRGACDIKGAAAALLSVAAEGAANLALLFTTDEEGGAGCCVDRFLAGGTGTQFRQVIVAEPTGCRAVLAHRGFLAVQARFRGTPGHSSEARALTENAIHGAVRWAAAALQVAEFRKSAPDDPGTCFNIGTIDARGKSNVIAGDALVYWSARLAPGESNQEFFEALKALAPAEVESEWEMPFTGMPLPALAQDSAHSETFCAAHNLKLGQPVSFWTEASLFSSAGLPALVLGPGHIAQAHQIDEWVAVDQLQEALNLYAELVKSDG